MKYRSRRCQRSRDLEKVNRAHCGFGSGKHSGDLVIRNMEISDASLRCKEISVRGRTNSTNATLSGSGRNMLTKRMNDNI